MTRPDLSRLPADNLWSDVKHVTVKTVLLVALIAPLLVSGQFLYFSKPVETAISTTPGTIVTQPPQAPVEKEPVVAPASPSGSSLIPPSQRRTTTTPKHRAPEEPTPTPTRTRQVAPVASATTPAPEPSTAPPAPTTRVSSTPIYDEVLRESSEPTEAPSE